MLALAMPPATHATGTPDDDPVREAVAKGLATWLSVHDARAEFSLSAASTAIAIDAASPRTCRMRPLPSETRPSPRLAIWVDCVGEGAASRSVMRTVNLKVWQKAWVALRQIRAGEPLEEGALARSDADVARQGHFAWQGPLAGHAVRRHVLDGDMLTIANVQSLAAIERGDRVRLVDRRAGIEIEALAVALQAGSVGQTIAARIDQANRSVLGRVVAPGELEIR